MFYLIYTHIYKYLNYVLIALREGKEDMLCLMLVSAYVSQLFPKGHIAWNSGF